MKTGSVGSELDQDGNGSVCLRPGCREEAVGHLALHHDAPELDTREPGQALDDKRSRDVVGEIGHELARRGFEPGKIECESVSENDLHVRSPGEAPRKPRPESAIDLDGVDGGDAIGEERREDSQPGTDLEHDVVPLKLGEPLDHAQDVLVDEKVLTELAPGPDATHGRSKAAAAFASIRAASSSASSPLAAARARAVWTTFAGSFGLPRTACGARYGESVSTRSRSTGTRPAAERRSSAFGYVRLPANEM